MGADYFIAPWEKKRFAQKKATESRTCRMPQGNSTLINSVFLLKFAGLRGVVSRSRSVRRCASRRCSLEQSGYNSSHKYSASKKALTPQNNCGVSFFSMSFIGIWLLRTQQKALLGRRPVGQGDVISLTSKLPSDL